MNVKSYVAVLVLFSAVFFSACDLETLEKEPIADFTYTPKHPKVGDSVKFISQSEHDFLFLWNFGDNEMSDQANPKHAYKTDGNYTVSLVVTAINGKTSTKEIKLTVLPKED